jgi:hypothetical protein
MKKKIKDLTLEEAYKICDEHISCIVCPLHCMELCLKDLMIEEKFEQEIEVEDDE